MMMDSQLFRQNQPRRRIRGRTWVTKREEGTTITTEGIEMVDAIIKGIMIEEMEMTEVTEEIEGIEEIEEIIGDVEDIAEEVAEVEEEVGIIGIGDTIEMIERIGMIGMIERKEQEEIMRREAKEDIKTRDQEKIDERLTTGPTRKFLQFLLLNFQSDGGKENQG
jgi:hypothetical protein